MYIVDSHCDSITETARRRHPLVNPYNFSKKHRQLQFVALFSAFPKDDARACYDRTMSYIGAFTLAMEKEKDEIVQVRTYADIEAAMKENKHAALLAIEGGTAVLGSTEVLRDFYRLGVRVFGLAWFSNDLAKSNRLAEGEIDTGLSDIGKEIVAEGNRLGMIFDVSHLSDKSFWDVASLSEKPVIASHSNFRSLCPHSRNLTDEMAREIVRRDGMIGLNLCTDFVHAEKEQQTVESYFRHLDYCLEHFGEDHIGFGGDIDGIDGIYPRPLTEADSIHDQLILYMENHGYSACTIEKVAGGNYLRFLEKYL